VPLTSADMLAKLKKDWNSEALHKQMYDENPFFHSVKAKNDQDSYTLEYKYQPIKIDFDSVDKAMEADTKHRQKTGKGLIGKQAIVPVYKKPPAPVAVLWDEVEALSKQMRKDIGRQFIGTGEPMNPNSYTPAEQAKALRKEAKRIEKRAKRDKKARKAKARLAAKRAADRRLAADTLRAIAADKKAKGADRIAAANRILDL
jgi:hypothetical protein